MKKLFIIFILLCLGTVVHAEFVELEPNVNMTNYWNKNGKDVQKVTEIGTRIINANKLKKRIPIQLVKTPRIINASTSTWNKTVKISSGILPYIDNDDEMAYVLGHEMAHAIDAYSGFFKPFIMFANSRQYEYKADLIGLDLMVKAGYNPIAAIIFVNKWMGEEPLDLFFTHPLTSKRLMAMYKYIYIKYPWALKTNMVKNINYQNFTYTSEKEIKSFQLREKQRASKRMSDL